jgi:hypothetical protein
MSNTEKVPSDRREYKMGITQDNERLHTKKQKEAGKTIEETSG